MPRREEVPDRAPHGARASGPHEAGRRENADGTSALRSEGRDERTADDTSALRGVAEHRGWHNRGYLPHLDSPNVIQAVTFRLADSIPRRLIESRQGGRDDDPDRRRAALQQALDRGLGACQLADPRVGKVVQEALLHFDGKRYELLEWVVMPNHVHVLLRTFASHPLSAVVQSWKSFTAKRANSMLGRGGRFWAPDYFDRFIRDNEHFQRAVLYIRDNPVAAGLVSRPEEWVLSSASHRPTTNGARPSGPHDADGRGSADETSALHRGDAADGARASGPQEADGREDADETSALHGGDATDGARASGPHEADGREDADGTSALRSEGRDERTADQTSALHGQDRE